MSKELHSLSRHCHFILSGHINVPVPILILKDGYILSSIFETDKHSLNACPYNTVMGQM